MYSLYIDFISIPQTFILRKFISSISDLSIDEKFIQFNPKVIINDYQYTYELKDFTYKNSNFINLSNFSEINSFHENSNIPPLNKGQNNEIINLNSINLNLFGKDGQNKNIQIHDNNGISENINNANFPPEIIN